MKTNLLNILMMLGTISVLLSCSGSMGNDVTKDPKYADISNQILTATQPLYYYHYTHSQGGKSGYFLSAKADVPNAEKLEELPVKSRVIIHKVFEVPTESGDANVIVQGKAFPDELHKGLEFMATYQDIEPILSTTK